MEEKELHYLLLLAFNLSNKAIVPRTGRENLMPGQPKILEFLLAREGCTQKEIGEGCILDKSTVTSLLSRMEENGLVRKEAGEADRRISNIFLTEKGKKTAEKVKEICAGVDQEAWGDISEEERKRFLETFRKILLNLKRGER